MPDPSDERSAMRDSRRLMKMSGKLRKLSKSIMRFMVGALLVMGVGVMFSDPFLGFILLVCGGMGVLGIFVLQNRQGIE
ncbi:MAG: hypothetical protein AAFN12_14095 [Cyanobacteria bacterium J06560_2]